MSGNVWKWVLDTLEPLKSGLDPVNLTWGSGRVFRGGCWEGPAASCGSASRDGSDPSVRVDYLGMQLALSPSQTEAKSETEGRAEP